MVPRTETGCTAPKLMFTKGAGEYRSLSAWTNEAKKGKGKKYDSLGASR